MIDKKDIFMSGFKSKIGYSFTYKDLNEFEAIIDFYERQVKKIKQPQMFIDTQDIEERYAEELYRDFLKEENKQLKKKLEEKENIACDWKDSCLENAGKIEILETQQKEFIKWLEDYLNLFDYRDIEEQAGYDMLEEILQKYREIIGGK